MIAPETLAAALRVAQHGAHRAMLAVRTDDDSSDFGALDDAAAAPGPANRRAAALPAAQPVHRSSAEAQRSGA